MNRNLLLIVLTVFLSCGNQEEEVLSYVDPMIGTDGTGHTFPGATTPFGMVQLSPSDDIRDLDFGSGYHYTKAQNQIKGFAHNQPWKTQEIVRRIATELYDDTPNGLVNNEDCGQMSSWYIFSALGFYPVTLIDQRYDLGSPLFDKATLNLENGKTFTVLAKYNSEKKYVQSIMLNGEPYDKLYIKHEDIMKGGELVFVMGDKPSGNFNNQ